MTPAPAGRDARRWVLPVAAVAVILVVGVGWLVVSRAGTVRYVSEAAVEAPLAPSTPATQPAVPPVPSVADRTTVVHPASAGSGHGAAADETAVAKAGGSATDAGLGAIGGQPVTANGVEPALTAFGHPAQLADGVAPIAIVVQGLGLDPIVTEAALALPNGVTLAYSAYASDLGGQQQFAHDDGHDVLLDLPLKAADPALDDQGPLAFDGVPDRGDLDHLLATGRAYVGVIATAGTYAAKPADFAPIARDLHGRGLGLVEIAGRPLHDVTVAAGVAYADAGTFLDEPPDAASIDQRLAELERTALAKGGAVGVIQAMPQSFARIVAWQSGLAARKLALVPVSVLLQQNRS